MDLSFIHPFLLPYDFNSDLEGCYREGIYENETQSTLPGAFPFGGHILLNSAHKHTNRHSSTLTYAVILILMCHGRPFKDSSNFEFIYCLIKK